MRFFNLSGPGFAERQTGKSTAMIAFAVRLRERGVAAVYASQGFEAVALDGRRLHLRGT